MAWLDGGRGGLSLFEVFIVSIMSIVSRHGKHWERRSAREEVGLGVGVVVRGG